MLFPDSRSSRCSLSVAHGGYRGSTIPFQKSPKCLVNRCDDPQLLPLTQIAPVKAIYGNAVAFSRIQGRAEGIKESYTYSDGFGRVVMRKVQAEPGDAPLRDASGALQRDSNGDLVIGQVDPRWVGSGAPSSTTRQLLALSVDAGPEGGSTWRSAVSPRARSWTTERSRAGVRMIWASSAAGSRATRSIPSQLPCLKCRRPWRSLLVVPIHARSLCPPSASTVGDRTSPDRLALTRPARARSARTRCQSSRPGARAELSLWHLVGRRAARCTQMGRCTAGVSE
jgi:hypothetical protein